MQRVCDHSVVTPSQESFQDMFKAAREGPSGPDLCGPPRNPSKDSVPPNLEASRVASYGKVFRHSLDGPIFRWPSSLDGPVPRML